MNHVLVFFAAIAIDWVWAKYIMYSSQKEAFKAAIFSVFIILIGTFVFIAFLNDRKTVIANALGAFVGTYLSIKYSKKNEK